MAEVIRPIIDGMRRLTRPCNYSKTFMKESNGLKLFFILLYFQQQKKKQFQIL